MTTQDRTQKIRDYYELTCGIHLTDEMIEKIDQLDKDFSSVGIHGFIEGLADIIQDHIPPYPPYPNQSLIK